MRTKQLLLKILKDSGVPLSEADLRKKLPVNKTTIYRALDQLKDNNLITEIHFGDGKNRYEIADLPHHHHMVCIKCKDVEDVMIDDKLNQLEQKITKTRNFKIIKHNLEFFGLCRDCV